MPILGRNNILRADMKRLINTFLIVILCSISVMAQEESTTTEANEAQAMSDAVYYVQVRVIFSGNTGIVGTVPRDLRDMSAVLKSAFKYPSYELSNTIRLSVFGGEDATALVFPNHYIRIIPKGETKTQPGLKLKAEVYEVQESIGQERFFSQGDFNLKGIKQTTEGSHSPVFPVVSSAMFLTQNNWEAIGGVPVRITSAGRVSGNTLSTTSLHSSSSGEQKYLILGLTLEKIMK